MQGRKRIVEIDTLLAGVERHADDALIVVDLLLASTTLVTSVAQGRTTWLARTSEQARRHSWGLRDPLLAAEAGCSLESDLGGTLGPTRLLSQPETKRPLVLVCPAAELLQAAEDSPAVYVTCLRNMSSTVRAAALLHDRVTVIAAGYFGQERSEDQMIAAWIAGRLMDLGYEAGGIRTAQEVARWSRADLSVLALGRGADHLRRLGHDDDVGFVLSRIDDLDVVCEYADDEVRPSWATAPLRSAAVAH